VQAYTVEQVAEMRLLALSGQDGNY
jgi:hypothetical protein